MSRKLHIFKTIKLTFFMKILKYIHLTNNSNNNEVIVGIHGWKGNKESFIPLTKNKLFRSYNWILPEAPYDVKVKDNSKSWSFEKEDGTWEIKEPKKLLTDFFNNVVFKKYKSKNVYVIGFSQGALVCYEYICHIEKQLGAIFPIAGFIRNKENVISEAQKKTPIVIGHGIDDQIVTIDKSLEAYKLLKKENANVKFHKYTGKHRFTKEIIEIIHKSIEKK